jgi:N-acetyl-gamma-glutamyl-phosphate reductase
MIRVGILGAKGYAAGEALRLLLDHPEVQVTCLMARVESPEPISKYFPALRGRLNISVEPVNLTLLAERCDAVILGLPHTVAQEFAPALLAQGVKVIDLSADFRFDSVALFEQTYGTNHKAAALNGAFPYALPELFRGDIAAARGLACPGCYPTSALLGLAPLMTRGDFIDLDHIVINSLSGTSGAGRAPSDTVHFCNVNESVSAYKVGGHRHRPEIEEKLGQLAGREVRITFTPHLMPMTRGILTTTTIPLRRAITTSEALAWYNNFYSGEAFVRVLPQGEVPATSAVSMTNFCDIGVVADAHSQVLIVVSAIDNLIKGASGQAIQAMNAMFGLPETMGLLPAAAITIH